MPSGINIPCLIRDSFFRGQFVQAFRSEDKVVYDKYQLAIKEFCHNKILEGDYYLINITKFRKYVGICAFMLFIMAISSFIVNLVTNPLVFFLYEGLETPCVFFVLALIFYFAVIISRTYTFKSLKKFVRKGE